MLNDFLTFTKDKDLPISNKKFLLAISGGIDSMVLADLSMKAKIDVGFAHCNFKLRGFESDGDEAFVSQKALEYGVEFFVNELDAAEYAEKKKVSIQMAARDLRYGWFEELMNSTSYDYYATAHHFDDATETFFINLFRGTGIAGLTGISAKSGRCIRPMLFATRSQIEDYAKSENIVFREDSSNFKNDYLRNRIRHFVMPALEKSNQEFRSGMEQTLNILGKTNAFLQDELDRRKQKLIFDERNGIIKISIHKLLSENQADFVLFNLLKPYQFNFAVVKKIIASLVGESGKRFLSPTHELVIDREYLLLFNNSDNGEESYLLAETTSEITEPFHMTISKKPASDFKISKNENEACLDFNKLSFPLKIRKHKEGEYFFPLGMKGRKKLSDFFIDQKLSIPEKKNTWLLISGGKVAWIIGHRIDDRFKITESTRKIYHIEII